MKKEKVIKSRKDSNENKPVKKKDAKSSLIDKVNSDKKTSSDVSTDTKPKKKDTTENKDNKKDTIAKKDNNKEKDKKSKPTKKVTSFFQNLSLLGKISLVVWMVIVIGFVVLIIPTITGKGQIDYGSRQQPVKVIEEEQVESVKTALDKDIKGNISVNYAGYRFVVVIDLGKDAKIAQAEKANEKAYKIIDGILPIKDYFSSTDQLNNDLFIYSTDVVPNDYNQKSSFIYETYKNSKMSKPESHDLMTYRDKDSRNEVKETMKDAAKGGK